MFPVAEKFVSINGEGTRAGELAVFIRFTGCDLRCSYCDTMWANVPGADYDDLSAEEILSYVLSTGVTNVTLTGGEPLLQKGSLTHLSTCLSIRDTCGDRDQRQSAYSGTCRACVQTGVHYGLQAAVKRYGE